MECLKLLVLLLLPAFGASRNFKRLDSRELTELEKYVQKPDDVYGFQEIVTYEGDNYTTHMLNVTSQRWLTPEYSDRPIWYHWAGVVVPHDLRITDLASLFYIGGSSNSQNPPEQNDEVLLAVTKFAVDTNSIAVYLNNIPNQPIRFARDPDQERRSNDNAIGFSWRQWTMIDNMTSPTELLLYFPMVKGGVRVMTATEEFVAATYGHTIDKWFIAGPSKWGWSTYLTAAVDPRVVAMVPMVMSLINIEDCMMSMWKQLGGWAFAMSPYYNHNLTQIGGTPASYELYKHQDPYSFFHLMDMPKLIMLSTSDEYFLVDNSWYWLKDMPGDNYFWLLDNTDHIMIGHYVRLLRNAEGFFLGIHQNYHFPKPTWTKEVTATGGRITVTTPIEPLEIFAWKANTTYEKRDFRWFRASEDPDRELPLVNGIIWRKLDVELVGPNQYVAEFVNPDEGWTAFYVEMKFSGFQEQDFWTSTDALIIPDTYPFEECAGGMDCYGTLV